MPLYEVTIRDIENDHFFNFTLNEDELNECLPIKERMEEESN